MNDKLNGKGILIMPNQSYLCCHFDRNCLNGIGIINFNNEDIFVGQWNANKLEGMAILFKKERLSWFLMKYSDGHFKEVVFVEEKHEKFPDSLKQYNCLANLVKNNSIEYFYDQILCFNSKSLQKDLFGFNTFNNIK